ncbi:cysteine--tRNA ligase [Candidatus Mycoplasma mahonii]|uniref:cysteine--tRNA ligase n=1 Tax=Candidatus Mycoplasma mahonii TaxID=3004105 RepID=UPI0026EAB322|nr:cysteine--tRNA ligase [Candidatus Mycoplasma mahonii]WKX02648.1 cysteine--tRNA ligase [Candidatus Mycoplasma mahonii]
MNIYLCGPTVYSEVHIGNLKPILTFDIFIRSLRYLDKKVIFIHNITDIDDNIITKASSLGVTEIEISEKYANLYLEELKTYNIIEPNEMPKVTTNIEGIVNLISRLIKTKSAYIVNSNVYFDVNSQNGYGKLSNRSLETIRSSSSSEKRNDEDFALWKSTDMGVQFNSPWGKGRPGWHTECAYFIEKYTRNQGSDLHGGGIDLLFPHHENENIQFIALHNKPITKEWKHIGHVMMDDAKMSKSLGNVFGSKEFAQEFGADTLRFLYLTSSITAPVNLKQTEIEQAKNKIDSFHKVFNKAQLVGMAPLASEKIKEIAIHISQWKFSKALKNVYQIIKFFNNNPSPESAKDVYEIIKLLGFSFTNNKISENDKNDYHEWKCLLVNKNFDMADKVRTKLIKNKII